MDEKAIIEKAKTNRMCHAGVRETDPELAAWMEGHRADCLCMDFHGVFWAITDIDDFRMIGRVYRLRPDYEPLRYVFDPVTLAVEDTHDAAIRFGWLEVTAEYANYLRTPVDGYPELRKPEKGDCFWSATCGGPLTPDCDFEDDGPADRGYRWCKPRVDLDAMRKAVADARAALDAAEQAYTMAWQRFLDAVRCGA